MQERHFRELPSKEKSELEAEIQTEQEQKWNDCREEIKKLRNDINLKAKESMGDSGVLWAYSKASNFALILQKIYPAYGKYIAYHELIGSSQIAYLKAPNLDFPEPNSVKSFLEKCLAELDA